MSNHHKDQQRRPEFPLQSTRTDTDSQMLRRLAELPALLASAPHRLMFFAGASALILSMLWWACVLTAGYFAWPVPTAPVSPGWAHALLTQYGMLALFIFGFLLTVFPRWLGQPALARRHYVPVFVGVFGGYLLAHIGLLNMKPVLIAGLIMMLSGWVFALVTLTSVAKAGAGRDGHAVSCLAALLLGACGLSAFSATLFGAPAQLALVAIKLGTFGLLLPIFFTVCHRMLPFFSASVVGPGYRVFRPAWSLPTFWLLSCLHVGLDLGHRQELLWLADVPMAALFLLHGLAWQPWKCMKPGLLAVLHIAYAWLPIAFLLYSIQSLVAFLGHGDLFGRAPVHALTVGFFASMLVAMVTRVSQGHSGRPLQMGAIAWLTFALVQVVALMRIASELAVDAPIWLAITAWAWLLAFLPWVLRSLWILFTPRIDGKAG